MKDVYTFDAYVKGHILVNKKHDIFAHDLCKFLLLLTKFCHCKMIYYCDEGCFPEKQPIKVTSTLLYSSHTCVIGYLYI